MPYDFYFKSFYPYPVYLALVALALYTGLYLFNKWQPLQTLRAGAAVFSYLSLLYALAHALSRYYWLLASLILMAIVANHVLNQRKSQERIVRAINVWAAPLAAYWALFVFYGFLDEHWYLADYQLLTHAGLAALAINLLALVWTSFDQALARSFKWLSHGIIILLTPLVWTLYGLDGFKIPYILYGFLLAYLLSLLRAKKEWERRLLLYCGLASFHLALYASIRAIAGLDQYGRFAGLLTGGLLVLLWALSKKDWRQRVLWFLLPFSYLTLVLFASQVSQGLPELLIFFAFSGLILLVQHRSQLEVLNLIPLVILLARVSVIYQIYLPYQEANALWVWLAWGLVLRLLGLLLHKQLWQLSPTGKSQGADRPWGLNPDWYSLLALVAFTAAIYQVPDQGQLLIRLLPHLCWALWFISNIYRIQGQTTRRLFISASSLSILVPYYRLLSLLSLPELIERELFCLPWLLIAIYLTNVIWKDRQQIMAKLELAVLIIISLVLLYDILALGLLADALIMGGLSLLAIIVGMGLKSKSYFFLGIINTLVTVIIETKYFWLSLPWWAYLLSAGLILITIASISEVKKNRDNKKLAVLLSDWFKAKFVNWR